MIIQPPIRQPVMYGLSCPCHQTWLQQYDSPRCTHCGYDLKEVFEMLKNEREAQEMGWP